MNLRQAAEMALEAWSDPQGMPKLCKAFDALREALAQPEQEPYAYTAEGECWSCRFTSKVDTEFRLKALNIPLEKLRYLYPHPAPIPEGWQLVPVEPTARMRNAFFQAYFPGPDIEVKIYKAMLAAAPKPEE